jgi:response regulator of citrate/malate metabolism
MEKSGSGKSNREPVRVLLVEDDPDWQQGIGRLLETHSRFELVAVADHFEAALRAFTCHQPGLALLDWQIRGESDGLAVGRALVERGFPPDRVIVVSAAPRASIPAHPFRFVSKARLAHDLLSLMEESIIEV